MSSPLHRGCPAAFHRSVCLFSEAIRDNILEEINPLSLFTTTHTWYIWFLSGVSSIVFLVILRIKARTMSIEHIHSEELPM